MGETDKVAGATPDQADVGSGFDVNALSEDAKKIVGLKVKEGADAKTIIETITKDYGNLEKKLGERKDATEQELFQRLMAGDPKDQMAKQLKEKLAQDTTVTPTGDTEELSEDELADAKAFIGEMIEERVKGIDASKDKAEAQAILNEIKLERRQQQEEARIKRVGESYEELVGRMGVDWLRPYVDVKDIKNSNAIQILFSEEYKGLWNFRNPLEAAIRLLASDAALQELNQAPSYTEGPGFSAPPRKASEHKKKIDEVMTRIEKAAPPTSKTLGIT